MSGESAEASAPPHAESRLPRLVRSLPRFFRRHRLIAGLAALFPGARISTFRFNQESWITADLADPAPRQALITGEFEPEFFALANAFLAEHTAFFDVGANAGFCTFGLLSSNSPARGIGFHLFEANPHLCWVLRRAAALYPQHFLRVHQACIAAEPGESRLEVVAGHWGGSFIVNKGLGVDEKRSSGGTVLVPHVVLDDFIEQNQIETVSLLKMDIEGFEPEALLGLGRSLRQGRVAALYLEVSPDNLRRYGKTPADLLALLADLDCALYWCKATDLERQPPAQIRQVAPVLGRESVRLARLESYPDGLQTDILAIPRNGALAGLT